MDMSYRARLLACLAGGCALLASTACDPLTAGQSPRAAAAGNPFNDPPLRPGKPRVLVLMPEFAQTLEVWASLRQELSPDFDVISRRIEPNAEVELIAQAIAHTRPTCIIIMNNPTLRLYRAFQRANPPATHYSPAIVVLTSFLEELAAGVKNAIGIAYEVPAVTQFAHLRTLIKQRITRVGIVHRPRFEQFVQRQREFAKREHIELVGVSAGSSPDVESVRSALNQLIVRDTVDALWVLNDNALLTSELLESAWLPAMSGARRVPVVVGVASLVTGASRLGTFAMVPDHEALGAQTASLVFELAEADWQTAGKGVEAPVSIKTIINGPQARTYFGFSEALRTRVDEVLE